MSSPNLSSFKGEGDMLEIKSVFGTPTSPYEVEMPFTQEYKSDSTPENIEMTLRKSPSEVIFWKDRLDKQNPLRISVNFQEFGVRTLIVQGLLDFPEVHGELTLRMDTDLAIPSQGQQSTLYTNFLRDRLVMIRENLRSYLGKEIKIKLNFVNPNAGAFRNQTIVVDSSDSLTQ